MVGVVVPGLITGTVGGMHWSLMIGWPSTAISKDPAGFVPAAAAVVVAPRPVNSWIKICRVVSVLGDLGLGLFLVAGYVGSTDWMSGAGAHRGDLWVSFA